MDFNPDQELKEFQEELIFALRNIDEDIDHNFYKLHILLDAMLTDRNSYRFILDPQVKHDALDFWKLLDGLLMAQIRVEELEQVKQVLSTTLAGNTIEKHKIEDAIGWVNNVKDAIQKAIKHS